MAKEIEFKYYAIIEANANVVRYIYGTDPDEELTSMFNMENGDHGKASSQEIAQLLKSELFLELVEIDIEKFQDLIITWSTLKSIRDSNGIKTTPKTNQELKIEIEEEKQMITRFILHHKDMEVIGYTHRTILELIDFLIDSKAKGNHLLITGQDGEIIALVDSQTLVEASFTFEKI